MVTQTEINNFKQKIEKEWKYILNKSPLRIFKDFLEEPDYEKALGEIMKSRLPSNGKPGIEQIQWPLWRSVIKHMVAIPNEVLEAYLHEITGRFIEERSARKKVEQLDELIEAQKKSNIEATIERLNIKNNVEKN